MDPNAKQQVVERLKNASNVLVTVSNNPSVDALAAAIGFSLLLSKLGKHATAVFSGAVPPAIEFLEPGKRFDKDVTGLRDFIIALDKDKADKLKYKVENDVVRIFITPYKSSLTKDDLRFEEGDFNVDAVVALGVQKREELDNAIKAHGRILHDASVLTVNAGSNSSSLGAVDWQDPNAGSLCEMLVSITESFGSGLLDEQMSTAFLTGIVAETERFSNPKTTPKVMTMSAQLMAAGANQQLIATNLDIKPNPVAQPVQPNSPNTPPTPTTQPADTSQLKIDHEQPSNQTGGTVDNNNQSGDATPGDINPPKSPPPPAPPTTSGPADSTPPPANAPHEKTLQELEAEISNLTDKPKSQPPAQTESKNSSEASLPPVQSPPTDNGESKPAPDQDNQDKAEKHKNGLISETKGRGPRDVDEDPALGGTFNATSEQAHEESVNDIRSSRNKTLLSHPGSQPPLNEKEAPSEDRPASRAKDLQPLNQNLQPTSPANPAVPNQDQAGQPPETTMPLPPQVPSPAGQPPAVPENQNAGTDDIEAARKAVEEAVSNQPFDPSRNPTQGVGAIPIQQETNQSPTQPGAPSEISIDEHGNLRLPDSQTGSNANGQDFQLPTPPNN